jgi:hypothetical protein
MTIPTASYAEQSRTWPNSGRHVLAHFDADTIVVYQAYSPAIGNFAMKHGHFGGDFKYTRMSWIKPNFLWMMYRSDWGRAKGQEVVLAIRLNRSFFDSLLRQAVASTFSAEDFADESQWKSAVEQSDVRLQWDPDHLPTGEKCERRAIQLGLRGRVLEAYGKREVREIIDVSAFVAEQRARAGSWQDGELQAPVEGVYVPAESIRRGSALGA